MDGVGSVIISPMKNCQHLVLFACALTVGVCAGGVPDFSVAKLRKDHPRLFFTAETWPAVKAQAEGPAHAARADLIARAKRYPANPVCSGMGPVTQIMTAKGPIKPSNATPINNIKDWGVPAAECALAWRLTGDKDLLDKAKKMLTVSVAAYHECYRNRRAVNWYSGTRIFALVAYDWIFEALTPEERKSIIVPFVQHVEDVQPGPGKPAILRRNSSGANTGFYGIDALLWYSGVAAAGDGFCDALAASHLQRGAKKYLDVLAFRNLTAGDDGGLSTIVPGYCMCAYPAAHFNFFLTCKSAFGYDLAADYPAMALFPNWIYWTWIPRSAANLKSAVFAGSGDDAHVTNALPTGQLYEHMTQYMFTYRDIDPAATRLAATLRTLAPNKILHDPGRATGSNPYVPFLPFQTNEPQPYDLADLQHPREKARYFEALGQIILRSGWTADSTFCTFTCGGTGHNHRHYDDTGFVIYKHDFLALDSGSRAWQTDYNLTHYYAQTVAHNCVLIHQPNEPLPNYWGLSDRTSPEGRFNDGGMVARRGKVTAFETYESFTYLAADAQASYGAKCRESVRQLVHIQPDVFVVYDRVEAREPSFRKDWLLHTQNEPAIEGRLMRADCGKGRLFCETLFPSNAMLTKVGGPGREFWSNGKNWELDGNFLKYANGATKKLGHEPYFGQWRLEVKPSVPAARDTFLHVLTATEAGTGVAVKATARANAAQEGVRLVLPGGKAVVVMFNKTGPVGGTIAFDGGPARAFCMNVQPQKGVTAFGANAKQPRFKPFTIKGQEPRPDFWRVRVDEIVAQCEAAKKCSRKEVLCKTPLGYPVYALFYGDFTEPPPQTNWSAGKSSTTYHNYTGRPAGCKQTFLFLAGIHGAEAESVAGAVNLIQMLETGRDFRGQTDPELLKLISKYRFIVVPCVNMDGRSISPDHLRGAGWYDFRNASQGTWTGGSLVGWRGSKSYFPLPLDRVDFPGGYPNGAGYNIMHDATPGDLRTEEAKSLLRLAARWRVDAVLNGHSCESATSIIPPTAIDTPENVARGKEVCHAINTALFQAGLRRQPPPPIEKMGLATTANLNNLFTLASGALALTLECTVSGDRPEHPPSHPTRIYSFEELESQALVALRAYLACGLEKPFVVRGSERVFGD